MTVQPEQPLPIHPAAAPDAPFVNVVQPPADDVDTTEARLTFGMLHDFFAEIEGEIGPAELTERFLYVFAGCKIDIPSQRAIEALIRGRQILTSISRDGSDGNRRRLCMRHGIDRKQLARIQNGELRQFVALRTEERLSSLMRNEERRETTLRNRLAKLEQQAVEVVANQTRLGALIRIAECREERLQNRLAQLGTKATETRLLELVRSAECRDARIRKRLANLASKAREFGAELRECLSRRRAIKKAIEEDRAANRAESGVENV